MVKHTNLMQPESYTAPVCKIVGAHVQRLLCLSDSRLDGSKFGNAGSAGRDVEEEDGGTLIFY